MIQGWHDDDYIILFEEQSESVAMTERYAAKDSLPGYTIVGIRGWDDFILRDADGLLYTVPTVPLAAEHLRPYGFDVASAILRADSRVADMIKWYVQSIIFGGDPLSQQNIAWITLDQHVDAVKWWNTKYRESKRAS